MILFIRKLPANTLPSELHHFVNPALKGGLFRPSGSVTKAELLMLRDTRDNTLEFHGLVHIDSEAAGRRAIKLLNGKRLKGRPVTVREYAEQRFWQNDVRFSHANCSAPQSERRQADRRRGKYLQRLNNIADLKPFQIGLQYSEGLFGNDQEILHIFPLFADDYASPSSANGMQFYDTLLSCHH